MAGDSTMDLIGQGAELHHHQGQRDAARDLFARIWDDIGGEQGDPLHVCVLAHSMADVQDDVRQELMWDLRALAAADLDLAREHLRRARAAIGALGDDGYGGLIKGGLERLAERLGDTT